MIKPVEDIRVRVTTALLWEIRKVWCERKNPPEDFTWADYFGDGVNAAFHLVPQEAYDFWKLQKKLDAMAQEMT